jgi:hypothetical protein
MHFMACDPVSCNGTNAVELAPVSTGDELDKGIRRSCYNSAETLNTSGVCPASKARRRSARCRVGGQPALGGLFGIPYVRADHHAPGYGRPASTFTWKCPGSRAGRRGSGVGLSLECPLLARTTSPIRSRAARTRIVRRVTNPAAILLRSAWRRHRRMGGSHCITLPQNPVSFASSTGSNSCHVPLDNHRGRSIPGERS